MSRQLRRRQMRQIANHISQKRPASVPTPPRRNDAGFGLMIDSQRIAGLFWKHAFVIEWASVGGSLIRIVRFITCRGDRE